MRLRRGHRLRVNTISDGWIELSKFHSGSEGRDIFDSLTITDRVLAIRLENSEGHIEKSGYNTVPPPPYQVEPAEPVVALPE